jgi:hypothetical protein
MSPVLVAATLFLFPVATQAQELSQLIATGRFEEAAAILTLAGPAESEAAALAIFQAGHSNGIERADYAYATRAMSAARQLPELSDDMRRQLNFWQGYSLYREALREVEPQSATTAQATLPKFRQAAELVRAAGEYAASLNAAQLEQTLRSWVELQETIIRRS